MMSRSATANRSVSALHEQPVSVDDVVAKTLDRIARLDPILTAFTEVTSERALIGARPAERTSVALGSDKSGLLPVLSSFCGMFGLKPTSDGPFHGESTSSAAEQECIGTLTRTAADLRLAYAASTYRNAHTALLATTDGIDGLRVAVTGGYFTALADEGALGAVDRVADTVNVVRTIDVPDAPIARSAAYIITAIEMAILHRQCLAETPLDYDEDVYGWLSAATLAPPQWHVQARRFRDRYRHRIMSLFDEVDIIIAPATPCAAPTPDQRTFRLRAQEMPIQAHLDIFTQPFSFIGLPVVTVPIADVSAPIGVQIIAAPWHESEALRVAAMLERAGIAGATPHATYR